MTPEDRFVEYFPGKAIHPMAYEEILLYDEAKYDTKASPSYVDNEIPVEKIVGTIGKNAGKGYCWADILVTGKKFYYSHWKPENIDQILVFESDDIFFYKDVMNGEYYIHTEGHHRVSFWKCMGTERIAAKVKDVYPREIKNDFSQQEEKPIPGRDMLARFAASLRHLIKGGQG